MLNEHPMVESSRLNLGEISKFRHEQVSKDKTINDFDFHSKVKFDSKKVQKEMSAPK